MCGQLPLHNALNISGDLQQHPPRGPGAGCGKRKHCMRPRQQRVNRQPVEARDPEGLRETLGAVRGLALAPRSGLLHSREDAALPVTIRASEKAHVLHYAHCGDPHLLPHADPLVHIHQTQLLRRAHHQCRINLHGLSHGEVDIAGPRRHVQQQVVEVSPMDLRQKPLHDARGNGPSDRGVIAGTQETKRHELHALVENRGNHLPVWCGAHRSCRIAGNLERQTWAVDVHVKHTHFLAQHALHHIGEVHGHR
mmetsp:Transcript_175266/g.562126  ORF Transcript_175266/g.562126 Transcript_175266/m.562126 type:complete len:252 (+) Transcript_175266:532-1287(+)